MYEQWIPDGADLTKDGMQYFGLLGDYIGGLWGSIISAATLLIILFTFRNSLYQNRLLHVRDLLSELLSGHHEIISSMEIKGNKSSDAFSQMLREFYIIYEVVEEVSENSASWKIDERIDIAYTFMFLGPQISASNALRNYGVENIKLVHDGIHKMRRKSEKYGKFFTGHQNRLAHYMRNLFNIYEFIQRSKIKSKEKYALAKIVRARLSNYEQGILTLNIISHFGAEWEESGLCQKLAPIKNIPEKFFTFDTEFNVKERFKYINFEWETARGVRAPFLNIRALGVEIVASRRALKADT